MLFLIFKNAYIRFNKEKRISGTYTTKKAFLMIRKIELIDKNEFIKEVINKNFKIFVAYISSLAAKMTIYLMKKAQIFLLLVEKFTILVEYLDFVDIFSKKLAQLLLKRTKVNEHAIE